MDDLNIENITQARDTIMKLTIKQKKLYEELQRYRLFTQGLQKNLKKMYLEAEETKLEKMQKDYDIHQLKQENQSQKDVICRQSTEILKLKRSLNALCGSTQEFQLEN